MDFTKAETVLDLNNIRAALVRMEDSIVFDLIERSQFFSTPIVYEPNHFKIPDFDGSFLDWLLLQVEKIQSQVRRYQAPDETPFFPDKLLPSFLPNIHYEKVLASYADEININDKIKQFYISEIVPVVACKDGVQPENIGSVADCDISCLQALLRRIHFGKFVAESKFRSNREYYTELIKAKDVAAIEASITNSAVEEKILERLVTKAESYGTDPSLKYSQNPQSKVKPESIARLYRDYVIPLTKTVEIEYLLRRLEDSE